MASTRAAASVGAGTPPMIQPCSVSMTVTKYGSNQAVATFGNPITWVDLVPLVAFWGQAEIGADIAGMSKTLRIIDYRDIGKRHNRPHARNCHQASRRCVLLRQLSDGLSFAQAVRWLLAFLADDRIGCSSDECRLDLTLRSRPLQVEQE
jgi:hypothetical protein